MVYGAGLCFAEVSVLKVSDASSERMLLRVEREGGQDRSALLSADLLALLRQSWKIGPQQDVLHRDGWLVPGQHA